MYLLGSSRDEGANVIFCAEHRRSYSVVIIIIIITSVQRIIAGAIPLVFRWARLAWVDDRQYAAK